MIKHMIVALAFCAFMTGIIQAEEDRAKPPLYFREDWKETPQETPVTQAHVHNVNLVLGLYGPGKDMIKKSHHDTPLNDPFYIWSGQCEGTWAVTLTKRGSLVDLTQGYIRWRTKNYERIIRVVVGLDDGSWLVGYRGAGETPDWQDFTLDLTTVDWRTLNIDTVTVGDKVEKTDLSRVRSVGFTDLEQGRPPKRSRAGPIPSRLDRGFRESSEIIKYINLIIFVTIKSLEINIKSDYFYIKHDSDTN